MFHRLASLVLCLAFLTSAQAAGWAAPWSYQEATDPMTDKVHRYAVGNGPDGEVLLLSVLEDGRVQLFISSPAGRGIGDPAAGVAIRIDKGTPHQYEGAAVVAVKPRDLAVYLRPETVQALAAASAVVIQYGTFSGTRVFEPKMERGPQVIGKVLAAAGQAPAAAASAP